MSRSAERGIDARGRGHGRLAKGSMDGLVHRPFPCLGLHGFASRTYQRGFASRTYQRPRRDTIRGVLRRPPNSAKCQVPIRGVSEGARSPLGGRSVAVFLTFPQRSCGRTSYAVRCNRLHLRVRFGDWNYRKRKRGAHANGSRREGQGGRCLADGRPLCAGSIVEGVSSRQHRPAADAAELRGRGGES